MKLDQFFIDRAAALDNDKVIYSEEVTVCKYPDGWLILWTNPIACHDLGRWAKDEDVLRLCLGGFWNKGACVRPGEKF